MADEVAIAYDKSDLRGITRAFKAMDENATAEAKSVSNGLATFVQKNIFEVIILTIKGIVFHYFFHNIKFM